MTTPSTPIRTLIRNAQVIFPDHMTMSDVLIEQGLIKSIGGFITEEEGDLVIDATDKFILPGFIDIHNHGAMCFDMAMGYYDTTKDLFFRDETAFQTGFTDALQYHLLNGTTRIFPTSLAAPHEDLLWSFDQINTYISNAAHYLGDMVGGLNVEGTFLKLAEYAGAQNPDFFMEPDFGIFEALQKASGRRIKIVNLPPEHGEKGLTLTRMLCKEGIIVSGGHTGANADQFEQATSAGLCLGVHFLNGPSKSISQSFYNGGAEEAMLRLDEVFLELIVDGYHVHPAYVRDVVARKQPERVILITDSMFVNGVLDINSFTLCGIKGIVSKTKDYLQVINRDDTLFGSVLKSGQGYENMLNWLTQEMKGIWYRSHEAMELADAMVTTSKMASVNPAQLLGLYETKEDDPGTGSIEQGKYADLLLIDLQENENRYNLNIEQVWLKGNAVKENSFK